MFVLIIDYGSGNIKSVYNSIKKTLNNFNGFSKLKVSRSLSEIEKADKVILPGSRFIRPMYEQNKTNKRSR